MNPQIAAEAAVWVARLHGPDRSTRMEREFLEWQARSQEHRLAFERCTETWLDVPRVTLGDAFATADAARRAADRRPSKAGGTRVRWAIGLSVVAAVLVGTVFQHWRGMGAYQTGVGEQQVVVLEDGTRMSLNTATRVRVDLRSDERHVDVQAGEAMFEVAKDSRRPFIVRAGGSEVVALGTVFSVRVEPTDSGVADALAVTLIEGRVAVRREGTAAISSALLLKPGERARMVRAEGRPAAVDSPRLDRPPVDQVTAWKRGEVVFDDVSLRDAIAEMNRYHRTPVVLVGDAGQAGRRVSGVFRTGDHAGFARAIAALHGLVVREGRDRVEIAPAP